VLVPELETEPDAVARQRMDQGNEFEEALLERFSEGEGDHLVIGGMSWDEEIETTIAAMDGGLLFIWNGSLPLDEAGRRSGKPDLLVREGDGYLPVDVKHHRTLKEEQGGSALVSKADLPNLAAATDLEGFVLAPNKNDTLQLAHYRRMLDACGFGSDSSLGGIIGKEGLVVWYDLDEPRFTTKSTSGKRKTKKRSPMEVYDHEFGFRLDVAAAARAHKENSSVELLVEPVRVSECGACGFNEVCSPLLEAGFGSTSLLPRVGYRQWLQLKEAGLLDRQQVADLSYPTAKLVSQRVDVPKVLNLAATSDSAAPVAELIPRAKKQIETLLNAGIVAVSDVLTLDQETAALPGFVAEAILNARAALGSEPVYRRLEADGDVPRADIEVDIDMENVLEGVYLWGALLTHRSGEIGISEGYHPFATFDQVDEESEIEVLLGMWHWLSDVRQQTSAQGLTFKAFVWHEQAENTQLRRIVKSSPAEFREEIDSLIASDEWVDLKRVFDLSWITGGSSSLKVIAPFADFDWEVEDAGGAMSMVKYDKAVDGDQDAETWLLDYNRGDVEATAAIREWLHEHGASWPTVNTR
jgi:predicted RecB family nuclease